MSEPRTAVRVLEAARRGGTTVAPFTDTEPSLDAAWGHAVQDLDRARRTALGERVVGAKLGLTSRAKQVTMGVHLPIVGFLTDAMRGVDPATLTQPRVEPEVAFTLADTLDGPLPLDRLRERVATVHVALELLDSRYTGYRFGLADVLADNTSAAGFVLGPGHAPAAVADLASLRCTMRQHDTVVGEATGAAILGDPWRALAHLAAHLADRGESLPAGSVVLAGAMTDAVPWRPGSAVTAEMGPLGSVACGPLSG